MDSIDATCSARLLGPIKRFVSGSPSHRDLVPDALWSADEDTRVSLRATHDMLDRGVERLGDERLGLRLGAAMIFGSGGAFDYAVRSAATLRDSMSVASKYARLLTDSFRLSVEDHGERVFVHVADDVSFPSSAVDFAMSALYKLHVLEAGRASDVECRFPYAEPRDTGDYRRFFPGARLRFDESSPGFSFDRDTVTAPLPGSEPRLHSVVLARVEALLSDLCAARPVASAVRRRIEAEIPNGNATAEFIARSLNMSRRTLTRRLELERTTFQAELDAVRQRIACEALGDFRISLGEVSFRTGFSHVESFHRAFRRWTGQTPLAFREAVIHPAPAASTT